MLRSPEEYSSFARLNEKMDIFSMDYSIFAILQDQIYAFGEGVTEESDVMELAESGLLRDALKSEITLSHDPRIRAMHGPGLGYVLGA
jgi:hypothetical protein